MSSPASTAAPPLPPLASVAPPAASGSGSGFHSASLYVGDLLQTVNEGLLFEIFNAVGPVASIRVCRDAITRKSLGYSYVNFHQVQDAERALDTMNYTLIKNQACRIMWSQRDPSLRKSGVGNVFVKNLDLGIDNKQLYDTFSLFGNILSCKVVTDPDTGKSKGYGYVHYETNEAALASITKLDGMTIEGIVIEVKMFTKRQERPDQLAWQNCFVKNIPYHWTDAMLETTFAEFGPVLSAAISKGKRSFAKVKKGKKEEEEGGEEEEKEKEATPTVKGEKKEGEGEDVDVDVDELAKEMEKVKLEKEAKAKEEAKEEAKAKEEAEALALAQADAEVEDLNAEPQTLGFGFVSFENHADAVAAQEALNEKDFDEFEAKPEGEEEMPKLKMFVAKAQKKSERERENKSKHDAMKVERINKYQGVNLYVKNLDDAVTDDQLREEFATLGTITSARVMKDTQGANGPNGNPPVAGQPSPSRGFGFVCFSKPEEATKAVNEMNGKIVNGKPIFVALAQRKDVRRAQLEAQHNQRNGMGGAMGGMRGQQGQMNPMMAGPYAGMQQMQGYGGRGGQQMMQAPYPMMPMMNGGRGMGGGRGGNMGGNMGGGRGGGGMMPGQFQRGPMPGNMGGGMGGGGPRGQPMGMMPGRGAPRVAYAQGAQNIPNPQQQQQMMMQQQQQAMQQQQQQQLAAAQQADAAQQSQAAATQQALTAATLASATPEMQKNMIGERLYPLIHSSQPELAGKITGMLLEMDNGELLHLLESPDALNSKIQEALQVLRAHAAQE